MTHPDDESIPIGAGAHATRSVPQLCPGMKPDIEEQLRQVRAIQERRKRERVEAEREREMAQRVTNRTRLLTTGELPSQASCGCDECIRRLLALERPLHGAHSEG